MHMSNMGQPRTAREQGEALVYVQTVRAMGMLRAHFVDLVQERSISSCPD